MLEVLTASGLAEYFSGVIIGDDVWTAKPHPELFLRALLEFVLPHKSVLLVADSVAVLEDGGH